MCLTRIMSAVSHSVPLTIEIDERPGWILSGDWAVPSRFTVSTLVEGFQLDLLILIGDRGPQVASLRLEHPMLAKGAPITQGVLRKITIDRLVKRAVLEARRPAEPFDRDPGLFGIAGEAAFAWGGRQIRVGRGSRTEDDHLRRVAAIYTAAVRDGRAPVKAVEKDLPCSRSHAGRLVGQARKAGLLRATSPGRASAIGITEIKPGDREPDADES